MRQHPVEESAGWQEKVVLAYIDEPPFGMPGPNGQARGCDVDLAMTVLRGIGVRSIEMRLATFAELVPGVCAGRWTINAPLFVTPQRAAAVAFSRPVWALDDGFIVRARNRAQIDGYRSIAAQGLRLGVVTAQVQRDSALAAGVSIDRIIEFATQHAAIAALLAGQVDAYASTALGNRHFVRELGNAELTAVDAAVAPSSRRVSPPIGAYSFAHRSAELRERFDQYLATHLGSAAHRERMASFGLCAREIDPIDPQVSTQR
jgi:polar amino acid transport system substrate-binding protein